MVAMPSDNGASARVTQRIPVSVRHPATSTLAISDSASIGATTQVGECFEDMLRLADNGVYQAKDAGRNRFVVV